MDNLHLKNLIQKPNGLIILKKLNNRNYPHDMDVNEKVQAIKHWFIKYSLKNTDH